MNDVNRTNGSHPQPAASAAGRRARLARPARGLASCSSSTASRWRRSPERPSGRSPSASAPTSRTCATSPRPATARTATAAPAWWRSRASACWPRPASARRSGMKVKTATERATKARAMVMELLVADQPERATSHDPTSHFWSQADFVQLAASRFPAAERWGPDASHPAMRVNLNACIQCNLCVRACREVQVNDVIGMAYRSHGSKIVFDFDDPMGQSTCVACGECVQACPTGALMPSAYLDENQTRVVYPDREVDSLCPYCGVGCQVTYKVKDEKIVYAEGRDGPANHNRLCVKGRFGFDYIHHPHRLTKPLVRLDNVPKKTYDQVDPANPWTHFREATWEEALERAAKGLLDIRDTPRTQGAGRLRLRQGLERGGLSVPEAGAHRLRLQQRRSLHAAVPRLLGGGPDGGAELGRRVGAVRGGAGCRGDHRHRRESDRQSPGRRDVHQERGQAEGRQADRDRPAPAGAVAPRLQAPLVQARLRRGAAERDAERDHHREAVQRGVHRGVHRELRGAEGQHRPVHARADGRGVRHRRTHAARGGAALRTLPRLDHLLGHGHQPARARHRQCALPDRARADHRSDRPEGHGPASVARPEQRAGRLRLPA